LANVANKGEAITLQTDAKGHFILHGVGRADIARVDITDVDLVLTTKDGQRYLLPNAGVDAMSEHPPVVDFSNGMVSSDQLLGEVGTVLDLATTLSMPSSIKPEGTAAGTTDANGQQQAQQDHTQQQQSNANSDVSALTTDSETSVEAMIQQLQNDSDKLHSKDYDYSPPPHYDPPPSAISPPAGVPPPISLTPIVTLFMGNVLDPQLPVVVNGVSVISGAGGASGSDPTAQIGPRDALQFSSDTINGTAGNDLIYADGLPVGNANPSVDSSHYAKSFILNVAGYFTSLNDITFSGVPTGATISGATETSPGTWVLPSSYVTTNEAFTLTYSTTGATGAFIMTVDVSGMTTRNVPFNSQQTFEFEYLPVTDVSQITNPTLVYDDKGYSKEIYVLPTLGQPNIINSGQGNDTVYGGLSNDQITVGDGTDIVVAQNGNNIIIAGAGNDTITAGAGNNNITTGNGNSSINVGNGANVITTGTGSDTIIAGSGNNTIVGTGLSGSVTSVTVTGGNNSITEGNGSNTIQTGNGSNTISVGTGVAAITTGSGNDSVTTAGGGGSINVGGGNNSITINSTTASTDHYTLTATGSGINTISGGDDDYAVSLGAGTNTVTLGNGTALGNGTTTFDTTVSTGLGTSVIRIGTGNNKVTLAGGGGSIVMGQGNQTIIINSTTGSTDAYALTTTGTGTTSITAGDDNYTIIAASGANNITIGNATTGSSITATGAGVDTIVAGNGPMGISAGSGNGSSIMTANGIVALSIGSGNNDSITAAGGGGTITEGNGSSDTIHAGLVGGGNYTITTGNGASDTVSAGAGTNIINVGTGGSDTVTVGNGNNTFNVGLGTNNTITGGTGSNTINFNGLTTVPLTIAFGTTGSSTATGTGVSDSFTGITTLYGTNQGDTITLNTGTLTVYAGSGNDTITLGSGTDTVYAGNGNNTIIGTSLTTVTSDVLTGGTGNNIFSSPDAGTTYNGTNGAALTAVANNQAYSYTNTTASDPFAHVTATSNYLVHSYAGGVSTVTLQLQTQINELNYASTSTTGLTINLATGVGVGGNAANSSYGFTPTVGYSSIDEVIGNNGTGIYTPSYSNTVLIGGAGANIFNDENTIASETVMIVANNTATSGGTDVLYPGLASEIFVGSTHNVNELLFGAGVSTANASNSAGVVINFDSTSHTFTSSLFSVPLTVAAYSGSNWGADATAATGSNSLSWTAGDFYAPVSGTATNIGVLSGSNYYTNLIFGGSNYLTYYAGSGGNGNYFYAGSGGSFYEMNAGYGVADVLTTGGTNIFYTSNGAYNSTPYNMYVVLSKAVDSGVQSSKDATVNLTYGGTTYTGFAYGWANVTTPVGNPLTYISGYENIVGYSGNDYFVGDNLGNQINAEAGSNTIILGDGTNIVTAIQGSNNISSSSSSGQTIGTNTLNFETVNNAYSGVVATYSGTTNNTSVEAFLSYSGSSTQSSFFSSAADEASFFGSGALATSYEVRTGTSSTAYSIVQAGIISFINGSDYSSGTLNSALAVGAASTSTNSSFVYDNVYSGAASIRGHAGADVFIDNVGTAAETFNGSADTSNIYYATSSQIPSLTITGSSTALNILRVEGWGASVTSGNAFGTSDPFSTTKITGITSVDVRSGIDNVTITSNTLTLGAHSTANASTPTFNLSATDIQNLVGTASTPTLILQLDSGDHFVPTGTASTTVSGSTTSYYNSSSVLIATDVHNASNYYSDVVTFNSANNAHLQIHYGTG